MTEIMSYTVNDLLDNNYWYERLLRSDFVNNVWECESLSHGITFAKAWKLLKIIVSVMAIPMI